MPSSQKPSGSSATSTPATSDTFRVPDVVTVPLRHRGRWAGYAVIVLLLGALAHSLITNERFGWDVVFTYLFSETILNGLWMTLFLTVVAMVIGLAIGILLASMRVSHSRIFRGVAGVYIWFFRGTPILVQLVFWYNLAYLYPELSIAIPGGPTLWSANVNDVITPLSAAILGLGLNEGAYLSEIVRAGILAVPRGQSEAAASLGMTRTESFRQIVLPQAMRVIVPPTGNETIGMLKMTSMVSVIALADLMYSAQTIYARNFQTIPLLICVSIWYLFLTSLLSWGQGHLERYFGRGSTSMPAATERVFALRLPRRSDAAATTTTAGSREDQA
ncbi:amino acid ABC transporter permease [Actinotalea sp. M2MS4P-6]|uniref:amino acid ABC transporter permease n=1 Tax=Actinotalea sp. M2MS4P-6 TaxID=2983762 RepID=UPI0021E46408|nr:amino acid ABC transporter permease [Actinotalea sp. M2MS4P-6]MCV2394376.1 amino acid ABC transporter permease [Actinotalea sp. M2MS4P-6]